MKKVSIFAVLTLLIFLCAGIASAESVTLPKNLKEIGAKAFYRDTSVTKVVVPEGVTTIGNLAFAFSGLTDITIPASVTSISESAFLGTEGLTIHAPDGSTAAEYAQTQHKVFCTFGNYPQTADGDIQPIEWLVLDITEDSVLLLSRYGLDCQQYNTEYTDVTWSSCTLRTWLNSTFLNKAFTSTERAAILTTAVDNSQSQHYDWTQQSWTTDSTTYKSYANTSDKIFLLSYAEANKYFGVTYENTSNMASRAEPTAYAVAQGTYQDDEYLTSDGKGACCWWLRSPGDRSSFAAYVYFDGSLYDYSVSLASIAVRPALWVNLESIF